MFDYSDLKKLILSKYKNFTQFGIDVGLSLKSVDAKLNNRRLFSSCEIYRWCIVLGIELKDLHLYFFKLKV